MDLFGTKAKAELKDAEARAASAETARNEATARADALGKSLDETQAHNVALEQVIRDLLSKNIPSREMKDRARALISPEDAPAA